MTEINTERELLIDALRTVDKMSGLLNEISEWMYHDAGDDEPSPRLAGLLRRRFTDCSGVHLFTAADNLRVELPKDLLGQDEW